MGKAPVTVTRQETGESCRWCGGPIVRQREWGVSWLECRSCGRPRALEASNPPGAVAISPVSTREITSVFREVPPAAPRPAGARPRPGRAGRERSGLRKGSSIIGVARRAARGTCR